MDRFGPPRHGTFPRPDEPGDDHGLREDARGRRDQSPAADRPAGDPVLLVVQSSYSGRVDTEESLSGGSALPLVVRAGGSERSLPPGRSYVVGRDPKSDIVLLSLIHI